MWYYVSHIVATLTSSFISFHFTFIFPSYLSDRRSYKVNLSNTTAFTKHTKHWLGSFLCYNHISIRSKSNTRVSNHPNSTTLFRFLHQFSLQIHNLSDFPTKWRHTCSLATLLQKTLLQLPSAPGQPRFVVMLQAAGHCPSICLSSL